MKGESVHIPSVQAVQEQESLAVWRMPTALSQSRLGGRSSPSNACTVIAVRLAEIIHRSDTTMPPTLFRKKVTAKESHTANKFQRAAAGHEEVTGSFIPDQVPSNGESRECPEQKARACPAQIICCLTNAIVDGNTIHEEAVRRRKNGEQNFTIPDAIRACRNSVMEVDFCSVPGPLSTELPYYIQAVVKSTQMSQDVRLFFLLIAFERTVLIVYERATSSLTLFDTHMHGQSDGAVIATVHGDNIGDLCQWVSHDIFHESQSQRDYSREFEISLIRFCGRTNKNDCCLPTTSSPYEFPVFATARRRRKRRLDTKAIMKMPKHAKTENGREERSDGLRASTCSRPQPVTPLASLWNLRSRNMC
ncbi:hypothetical protein GCK32_001095 [Trichostrongylus colubriformis]|uniref:Uncharacterized protein n=1 Tax=Trichostrongylus colubriformis TaxID=6319 RepID=A0AAN8F489_TRICO